MKKFTWFVLLVSLLGNSPVHGQEPAAARENIPGIPWEGALTEPAKVAPEPSWSLRTGMRKGVLDQALPEEVAAGPDIAVLGTGWHAAWPGLLAEFRESYAFAAPDDVAAMARHKPLLIIPTNGLEGLGASSFFRAGVAEFVRAGGIVLCMAQRRGVDLAALPVPEGEKLDGAGWSEDHGPIYRRSAIRMLHPAASGLERIMPSLETNGYLRSYPPNAVVLLARQDGRPTLVLYPYGKGWIAVSSLFSDFSASQGMLAGDERTLLRGLLLWAKSGGRAGELAPGATLSVPLRIMGGVEGSAAAVRVQVIGPLRDRPRDERTFPLTVAAQREATLPYTYTLPADIRPGIYHLEYQLQDSQGRTVTPAAESGDGWFVVLPPMSLIAPSDQAISLPTASFSVSPLLEQTGNASNLTLSITRTGGQAGAVELLARAGNQEKHVLLTGNRGVATFQALAGFRDRQVPFALDHAAGWAIVRGSASPASAEAPKAGPVTIEQRPYRPGQTIRVSISGMGLGALTINGLGTPINEHVSSNKNYTIPVPKGLPSGTYPIEWEFQTRSGQHREGAVPVNVEGISARCEDIRWEQTGDALRAILRISATAKLDAAIIRLRITRSGRSSAETIDHPVSLAEGMNTVTVPIPVPADTAGIWEVRHSILANAPEGPGFPTTPLTLDHGAAFIDAGNLAILGLSADPPVSYAPRGRMTFSAVIQGASKSRVEFLIDGKRAHKETIGKAGLATVSYQVKSREPGPHRLDVVVQGEGPGARRQRAFVYGSRLPDLVPIIQTSAVKVPALEIGVGVLNRGKVASGRTTASLYEGDPARDGIRIATFEVPPLEPGTQHVVVAPWPLAGKAGERKITAVIDNENAVIETDKSNNTAVVTVSVPDVFLEVVPRQESFAADGEIAYDITLANFTAGSLPLMTLSLQVTDPAGKTVSTESIPVVAFESGGTRRFERKLGPDIPQEGIYLVEAQADVNGTQRSSDSVGLLIRPTLAVKGSLTGTPATAAPCQPLTIRYSARNGGNVPFTGGVLKLEIRSAGIGQLVHAIQLPLTAGEQTHRLARLDFPNGEYRISLRASAVSQPSGMTGEFLLDEQPLSVRGPVAATPVATPLPRLLVWTGGESETSIERALSDKLLREAFSQEGIYIRSVSSAEAFSREALTGLFNMFLLIDIDSTLDTAETLRAVLARGNVVVLAGSNDRCRALAEQFKFLFSPASDASYITFAGDSPLGLNGTLPFSRPAFSASRKGAQPLAVYSSDQPAVLVAPEDAGKVVLLPFSLIHSALAAGTSTPYSLLVRAIIFSTAPREQAGDTVSSGQISVAAAADPIAARIAIPLAEGEKLVWANRKSTVANGSAVFDLTADKEPQQILYLLQAGKPGGRKKAIDVQYKCGGAFVSQGKVE